MLPPCFTPFRSTTLRWSAIRIVKYPCRDGPKRISHSVGRSCERTSMMLATSPGKTLTVRISSATTRRYFGAYPCSGTLPLHPHDKLQMPLVQLRAFIVGHCHNTPFAPTPHVRLVGVKADTGILKSSSRRCLVRKEIIVPNSD